METTKKPLDDFELSYAEIAIEHLSKALNITEKEIVSILENGFVSTMIKGKLEQQEKFIYLIDEMKATFDAY